MDTKKKNIIVGIAIGLAVALFIIFGTLACFGDFRDFDAQGYVTAMLDKTLKGDVDAAVELLGEAATEETLLAQYEATIENLAKSSLPEGMELTEELQEQYIDTYKKVFASMKYEVQEAEKISDDEYQVAVQYQPADVFQKYNVLITEEGQRIYAGKENGDYRGTNDEINAQMKEEFLNNICALFEEACNTMEYGETQTVVFKVVKGEDDLFKIDNSEITEFIKKILGLDAIQD